MKKTYLIVLMLFVFSFANAQKAKLGLKLGVALPSMFGNDYSSNGIESRVTPSGGIYINSEISDYFWFKHEVTYVNRGFSNADSGNTKLKMNQHYIDLYPLSPCFHFKGGQLFAGPAVNFLVYATEERLDASGVKKVYTTDLDENSRSILELGFVAGAEYEFPFGLSLGARYVRGFSSLYQPEDNMPRIDVFNQTWLFSLGFTFGANKKEASPGFD